MEINTHLLKDSINECQGDLKKLFCVFLNIEKKHPSDVTQEQVVEFVLRYTAYYHIFKKNFLKAVLNTVELEKSKVSTQELCYLIANVMEEQKQAKILN